MRTAHLATIELVEQRVDLGSQRLVGLQAQQSVQPSQDDRSNNKMSKQTKIVQQSVTAIKNKNQ